VSKLVNVTFALGTVAPVASVTRPMMSAVVTCAASRDTPAQNSASAKITRILFCMECLPLCDRDSLYHLTVPRLAHHPRQSVIVASGLVPHDVPQAGMLKDLRRAGISAGNSAHLSDSFIGPNNLDSFLESGSIYSRQVGAHPRLVLLC